VERRSTRMVKKMGNDQEIEKDKDSLEDKDKDKEKE
jgi:hypothetical protein